MRCLPTNEKSTPVFQRYALFPHLDVYDNIAFGLRIAKLPEEEIDERVTEMLEIVSLKGFENRKVTSLSGGQQQRVAIARALAGRPSLLLADEPTGNLDSRTGADVMRLFHELHEAGNTIVLITHDAKIAAQTPRAIHIHDGRVLEPADENEVVI